MSDNRGFRFHGRSGEETVAGFYSAKHTRRSPSGISQFFSVKVLIACGETIIWVHVRYFNILI